jgi:4-amino-4-deoxy-L-arabinose transferase-like glycosyltransferase
VNADALSPRSEPKAEPKNTLRVAPLVFTIVCSAVVVFCLGLLLTFGFGRDQGLFTVIGRVMLAGGMPYRDAWDIKPPGIYLLYAATVALFGGAQVGIRIVEALGLAASVLSMMRLTKEWWGEWRVGLLAGAVAVFVHVQFDFWQTAQAETFGGMLTIFTLLALGPILADAKGPLDEKNEKMGEAEVVWRFLIAGFLQGLAGLLKPPFAAGLLVIPVALAVREHRAHGAMRESLRVGVRAAALLAAGTLVPFVLCIAWFWKKGALGDLWETLFVFNPHYSGLAVKGSFADKLIRGFVEWPLAYSSLMSVGLFVLLGFPVPKRERFGVAILGALILVFLVGVFLQGKFFPYHYTVALPLTAMLAALGLFRVWEQLATRPYGPPLFFVLVALAASVRTATMSFDKYLPEPKSFWARTEARLSIFTHWPIDQDAADQLAHFVEVNAETNHEVAAYLRDRVPEDRTLFVWGFEAVLYEWSQRWPAARYLMDQAQRAEFGRAEARERLMRDLEDRKPAAIVVEHGDVLPLITGDNLDSAGSLREFPALSELVAERFGRAKRIKNFDVYLERK